VRPDYRQASLTTIAGRQRSDVSGPRTILVDGTTNSEVETWTDRVNDAMQATRAALQISRNRLLKMRKCI
jgi:chaperonin GroEL (HSP60 family)